MIVQLASLVLLLGTSAAELQGPRAVKLYHPTSRQALEKRGSTVAVENRQIDAAYFFDIKVGTPEQTVQASLGSLNSASMLYGRPDNANDPGFLRNSSSTFKPADGAVGQGFAEGTVRATDKITVGNDTRDDVAFYYAEGYANSATWAFGFPEGNATSESFWHKASAGWADKRLGLFLSRHREEPKAGAEGAKVLRYKDSELIIGGVNNAKYTGEISMNAFQPGARGGWSVPLESLTVNGKDVPISTGNATKFTPPNTAQTGSGSSNAVEALVITADSMIYAPNDVVKAVYANIPGAQPVPSQNNPQNSSYQFPCNTIGIDVRLKIGGKEYAIQARDMVVGLAQDNLSGGLVANGPTPNTGMCLGAIMTAPSDFGWRLGTTFLKNVYTVFDFAGPAVGFAQLAPDAQPTVEGTSPPSASSPSKPSSWATPVADLSGVVAGAAVVVAALAVM